MRLMSSISWNESILTPWCWKTLISASQWTVGVSRFLTSSNRTKNDVTEPYKMDPYLNIETGRLYRADNGQPRAICQHHAVDTEIGKRSKISLGEEAFLPWVVPDFFIHAKFGINYWSGQTLFISFQRKVGICSWKNEHFLWWNS